MKESKEKVLPKIRPLASRLLVEVKEAADVTPGGIVLPDTAKDKPSRGKVLAVGSGTRGSDGKLYPVEIEVGEVVLFSKWSGTTDDEVLGKGRMLINEQDILAIVEE